MKNNLQRGILYAFGAAIISGIAIFYSKISVTKIDPIILTTSRNLVAGGLLVISYILFGKKQELEKIKKGDLFKLIFIGIFGGGIPFLLFFTGLKIVETALIANLIQKTLFIWVSLLAMVFLKEKLNWKYWISFLLIVGANLFLVKSLFSFGKGEMLILTATLLWSVENIFAKKVLKNISSELASLFRMGVGSIFLLTSILFTGKLNNLLTLNNQQLTIILIGGVILSFYVSFWYKALKFAPVSLVTLILTFSVVVGNILNGSFGGIQLTGQEIISSGVIVISSLITYFAMLYQPVRFGKDGTDKLK